MLLFNATEKINVRLVVTAALVKVTGNWAPLTMELQGKYFVSHITFKYFGDVLGSELHTPTSFESRLTM